jgi:hypothetical protein
MVKYSSSFLKRTILKSFSHPAFILIALEGSLIPLKLVSRESVQKHQVSVFSSAGRDWINLHKTQMSLQFAIALQRRTASKRITTKPNQTKYSVSLILPADGVMRSVWSSL